jgi:hypothetical protein
VAALIPQPVPPAGVDVAPESARIDLAMPTFSHPTEVTNRLFPVSDQASVLMIGHVDGKPFRTEVTLLPFTRFISWQGRLVETLVSQYVAYLDGQIQEVAYDHYAQADDGSVWYFGEDVADFENGVIVTTEGTWIAGKDGPAAMIMPGAPKVGDVYRTENVPGLVFEQVTVQSVDTTLDGPLRPVPGGLVGRELHDDGTTEDKQFGPGYGEFSTTDAGGDLEALALAVPTDALPGPMPAELTTMTDATESLIEAAAGRQWSRAAFALADIRAAWGAYGTSNVPKSMTPLMVRDLGRLAAAVRNRKADAAQRAALDVRQWALDLELRHRPAVDVDIARFGLWAERLALDVAARSRAATGGDIYTLDYIRDRILQRLDPAQATELNTQLGELQIAVVDHDFAAMTKPAATLRDLAASLR